MLVDFHTDRQHTVLDVSGGDVFLSHHTLYSRVWLVGKGHKLDKLPEFSTKIAEMKCDLISE